VSLILFTLFSFILFLYFCDYLLCFLISDKGKETLSVGEEKLDDLFTYKERDEVTYFISEGLGDQELDVGPSGGAAAIQGYESEDVEILDPPEERQPIAESPVEELANGRFFPRLLLLRV